MDERSKLMELAAVYRYLGYGYPLGDMRRHVYHTIAANYEFHTSIRSVRERLQDLVWEGKQYQATRSSSARQYQRLGQEIACYQQALADMDAGFAVIPARRVSFRLDGQ